MATGECQKLLTKYKCLSCDAIPTENEVKQCSRGHIICMKCSENTNSCECKSGTLVKIPNPLVQVVETKSQLGGLECPYKEKGCTWQVSRKNHSAHINECMYRPYSCIGNSFQAFKCNWKGVQHELANHMEKAHRGNGNFFPHWHSDFVVFDPIMPAVKVNLINAFNKKFVFVYLNPARQPFIVFFIYLLGRQVDAQKFMIDFELKDGLRKIKFVENCYSDVEKITDLMDDRRSLVILKQVAMKLVKNARLQFRFIIKKKSDVETENIEKRIHLEEVILHGDSKNGSNAKPCELTKWASESQINSQASTKQSNQRKYKFAAKFNQAKESS